MRWTHALHRCARDPACSLWARPPPSPLPLYLLQCQNSITHTSTRSLRSQVDVLQVPLRRPECPPFVPQQIPFALPFAYCCTCSLSPLYWPDPRGVFYQLAMLLKPPCAYGGCHQAVVQAI